MNFIHAKIRKCCHCGKEFLSKRISHKYCCRSCRIASAEDRRSAGTAKSSTRKCPICENEFKAKNNFQKYCSVECSRTASNMARKKDMQDRVCPTCGKTYYPHNPFQKYCCTECFKIARAEQRRIRNSDPKVKEAKNAYMRARYADPENKKCINIKNAKWAAEHKDKVMEAKERYRKSEKGIESRRRYEHGDAYRAARFRKDSKRRFRKHNNGDMRYDEGIHWKTLSERIGSMKCCICGRECIPGSPDKKLRPTVDHIVSLYVGGSHTWNNVALMCMECNSTKGGKRTLKETSDVVKTRGKIKIASGLTTEGGM